MGQGKLHSLILTAGIFTLGAVFGHQEKPAAAQSYIVLDEVVIAANERECTGADDDPAECFADGEERSECVTLPDGQGFYTVTCF